MAECHPVGFQWVMEAKERGTTIIHVGPRFNRTSALADIHMSLRAGTDSHSSAPWSKHCTHAACLDVCPTGSLFHTEFGTVVVQKDICNGCGYGVPACPYGVIDIRPGDGRTFKCTLCYDRSGAGREPACAQACPTDSIRFGPLEELRERADRRVTELHERGVDQARLYGRDPQDGVSGDCAFFLLLDEPEVYGLPPDPVVTTRDLPSLWRHAATATVGVAVSVALSFLERGTFHRQGGEAVTGSGERERPMVPRAEFRSYYGRPILKRPTWRVPDVPGYLFLGGTASASATMAAVAELTGRRELAGAGRWVAAAASAAGVAALVHDLGRPGRFAHMLRVLKPTSPLSVGSWILAPFSTLAAAAAASQVTGRLPGLGRLAGLGSGVLGPAMCTYTAVLLSDTAVPA